MCGTRCRRHTGRRIGVAANRGPGHGRQKRDETKSGSYKITFISDLGDLEGATGVVRQTDANGKMKIEDIPDPVLPSYLADDHTSDKPGESDGWCHDPTFFNKDTDPINFRTETFTKDTKVWAHWNQQNYVTFINQDPTDPNGETTTQKFETFGIEHTLKEQPVDPPDYPGFVSQGWYKHWLISTITPQSAKVMTSSTWPSG